MQSDEFDIAEHRQNFSFFYDRAHEIESNIADLVFRLRGPVIDLLQAPRDERGALTDIPEYVVTNIEAGFTLAVKALRECRHFSDCRTKRRRRLSESLSVFHLTTNPLLGKRSCRISLNAG